MDFAEQEADTRSTEQLLEAWAADEQVAVLSPHDRQRLIILEAAIETGVRLFVESGRALAEIRESRLYREQYGTFEAYCKERWGFNRNRANQLIEAAAVFKDIEAALNDHNCGHLPSNEGQMRALRQAPPDERPNVWQQAVKETKGKPTAKAIREVIRRVKSLTPGEEVLITGDHPMKGKVGVVIEIDAGLAVVSTDKGATVLLPDQIQLGPDEKTVPKQKLKSAHSSKQNKSPSLMKVIQQQPRIQWQCVAFIEGRLKRSKPDEKGNRKLFFQATDGTTWAVPSVGREDNNSLIWLLTHIEDCFNADNLWSVYPQSFKGTNSIVPAAIVKGRDRAPDSLQFSASVGSIDLKARPSVLPLFVGRNCGRGFHFVDLSIPKGFDLPALAKGDLVQGAAVRLGDTWALSSIGKATP